MGTRGRGSLLTAERRAEAQGKKWRFPWNRKGLKRWQRVEKFLEWLPITKGPLAGRKMKLLPEQRDFVREVYGNLDRAGLRRRRIGIKSEPKGNGKTGLTAGLCLCHLLGPEAEARGEVYSAAIDRQQAALIFAEMEAIIIAREALALLVNVQRFHKKIEVIDGPAVGSIYEALSADARRAHGLAPSLFAYDELAQAKDRVLLDNLINGLGKRKEALGIIISTQAPDDDHPLSQLIDDGLTGADPSIFVQLLAAPPEADPFVEETWRGCNPALGIYLSLDEMRTAAERARRIPAFEPAFRNLRLNQRVDAREEARLTTASVWKGGDVPVDRARLKGRKAYAALDLSGKHDLTSLTLVIPDDEAEPGFDILPFFWTPQGQLEQRRPAERDKFKEWIKAGHIEAVPGPVIRYSFVAKRLFELSREFEIVVLGYDRWRIDDFKADLADIDAGFEFPLEPFGQGYQSMSPAIEWFTELALTGRLRHGGNPVLTACVANAVIIPDPAGNQKIDKAKARGPVRIDGAVTLVMALALAKRAEPAVVSFWETMASDVRVA